MWLNIDLCISDKQEEVKCKSFSLYVIRLLGCDIFNALALKDDEEDKIEVLLKEVRGILQAEENVNTRCQGTSESVDCTEAVCLLSLCSNIS